MRKTWLVLPILASLACNLSLAESAPTNSQSETHAAPGSTTTALSGGDQPASDPIPIVPVPAGAVLIEGASYQAYQASGDPFRFVCPDPCPVDPELLYAQYAGFHKVYENLIGLTGVDTLPELQPVDIHILNDAKCGLLSEQPRNGFSGWETGSRAFICSYLFEYAMGIGGGPYTPADALRPDWQSVLIHEYLHTLFFGRTSRYAGALHDFVTPIAMYAWMDWEEGEFFCEYHPETPPGDYGGYLLEELCTRFGFQWEHLKRSLNELDALYRSGAGLLDEGFQQPVPDMTQFRDILDRIMETDTSPAFRNACWPAVLFGESYTLPASCTDRTATPRPTALP
jgi:hypothetical protein